MGKIAFVYAGQGDQYPGMGQELTQQYPCAAEVFARCDAVRPNTSRQCFGADEEELKQTVNTQPCLFAFELAATAVLRQAGIQPAAVAGFSLGEVAAATAAGIFDLETGFRAVCLRGQLMQQASEQVDAAMAAVVKLTPETVCRLCSEFDAVYPVNFNCPGQITVSGLAEQMQEFSKLVRAAGGRAIPLKVRGAFHSPFMADAAQAFGQALEEIPVSPNTIPLYSNVTGQPYDAEARHLLSRQICSPVQWESTICHMIASGIDTFIEIGPGMTLTNMTKKINSSVKTYCVKELTAILQEVCPC